jgi:hypothetical protein
MRSILTIAALALGLIGCTSTAPQTTVANGIAGAEQLLTQAEIAATVYEKSSVADADTVAKIKAADTTAYNAVKAAEAGQGTLDAALSALADLVKATPVKGS